VFKTLTADTTPPTVTIVAPTAGQAVNGTITVSGTAADNRAINVVELKIDGGSWVNAGAVRWSYFWESATAAAGAHTIQARATDRSGNQTTASVTVYIFKVIAAAYSSVYATPLCDTVGSACDTGSLLAGRGTMANGIEPNNPNALFGSCVDSNAGAFHVDESMERLVLSGINGNALTGGQPASLDATVWAFSGSDYLDVYTAADANAPVWTLVRTIPANGIGLLHLFTNVTLGNNALQAIRTVYRYGTTNAGVACAYDSFRDTDDLVFRVNGASSSQAALRAAGVRAAAPSPILPATALPRGTQRTASASPNDAVLVYPNPVRNGNVLNIRVANGSGQTPVRLYSAAGETVSAEVSATVTDAAYQEFQVRTSALASGVYYYRIGNADNGDEPHKGSFMVVK
jgi:hypothetical protein